MKVIFDMDGTLNFWETGTSMEEILAPGYMQHRRPHENMLQAAKLLIQRGVEVFTLSAVFDLPHFIPDKEIWLNRYFPELDTSHRFYSCIHGGKGDYLRSLGVNRTDVFVDDYNHNLREIQALDLITCMKCVCPGTNDIHRSWDGERLFVNESPEIIVQKILG